MVKEIQKAAVWSIVFAFVGLSYVVTAHLGYAHGYDAGYHEMNIEANDR